MVADSDDRKSMRSFYPIIAIVAAACAATAVFGVSYNYFKSEEQSKAAGRLSLYRSTVVAELERFSHLTYVLARDAFVIDTAQGRGTETLNQRLAAFAQQSGLDAIYLMRPDGVTISASNASQNNSFVGQDYSFRPYFQQAMQGQQGRFYGIGATTGLPGYFIADAVTDERAQITGVVAIKLDLSKLEDSWRAAGEQVFLANRDGVVLLSADPTCGGIRSYRTCPLISAKISKWRANFPAKRWLRWIGRRKVSARRSSPVTDAFILRRQRCRTVGPCTTLRIAMPRQPEAGY